MTDAFDIYVWFFLSGILIIFLFPCFRRPVLFSPHSFYVYYKHKIDTSLLLPVIRSLLCYLSPILGLFVLFNVSVIQCTS